MIRSKEELINGIIDKESIVISTKSNTKRPIEIPRERKLSNSININDQKSIKPQIIDYKSSTDGKNIKTKFINGNNALKNEITESIFNVKEKNLKIVKNIGFENLPNQIYRRSLLNGFEFNLMVVGCSGLGKSTFVNSLFLSELYGKDYPSPSKRIQKTTCINTTTVSLTENSVNLKLTLIDTPGFGDSIDNSNCWKPIVEYIELKYNEYMLCQNNISRWNMQDKRVHVCLYFIEPTGHGLKPLDLEYMAQIHTKVNVVPIIAKADSLLPDECADFKRTILTQIKAGGIKTYDFSEEIAIISIGSKSNKSDINLKDIIIKRRRQPFAIVSSNATLDKGDNKVRARIYPWGVVEVDNLEHNDFSALRTLLLSSHLQDLKDHTNHILYENFRFMRLTNIAKDSQFGISDGKDPMSQMDEERREFAIKINKMEKDMEQLFEQKVQSKTKKLEEFQKQIEKGQQEMEYQLDLELKELEYRRNKYECERLQWEEMCRDSNFRDSVDQLNVKDKSKSKSKWHLK